MADGARIMVISHGHPDLRPGGGENAAFALFGALRERPGIEAVFVFREPPGSRDHEAVGVLSDMADEVAIRTDTEPFRQSQRHPPVIHRDFRRLLDWFRPDIVHFHHYLHIGLEALREVRAWSSSVPIVLTLHEYMAICHHHGQMVTTIEGRLCERAGPQACHGCFPDIRPEEFFLRELYVKSLLAHVDAFVAPSHFLMGRYVDWGLPPERFVVIENGLRGSVERSSSRQAPHGYARRFGFFGQITPTKGLHVLLDAMSMLPSELRQGPSPATLDVHGSGFSEQRADHHNLLQDGLKPVRAQVTIRGPYAPREVRRLMERVDWVVVPSTWWENSPLVIQEAFATGVPVICSDIGGMAEKVTDGVNGLHFRVGDARHLAERLTLAATSPGLWERLRDGIPPVTTAAAMADEHLALYEVLSSQRQGVADAPGVRRG